MAFQPTCTTYIQQQPGKDIENVCISCDFYKVLKTWILWRILFCRIGNNGF